MILEEATKEAYGYYPSDLKPQSNKPIIAVCDDCGTIKITSKHHYRGLCISCTLKGKTNALGYKHTEEQKANTSAAMKGNTYGLGYKHTEEAKAKIGAAHKGIIFTEERKTNISAALKGKTCKQFTKEHKTNMRKTHADMKGEKHPN